ncbi:MAG: hypothetical protein F4Y16_14115 [Holophagales bacterium]|nr:hypothetical protein [Holophagales bacterium]MYH23658.1 hypothetical protein [Holophagales bacterium]
MDECAVIVGFVRFLGCCRGNPELVVDRWPDKENRTEPEIDAVAGDFAIEHASVDTVNHQRERDASYLRVVGDLEPLIEEHVGGGFTVALEFDAIGKGRDWSRARASLKKWIEEEAPLLQDGSHRVSLPTSCSAEVPIVMHIRKGLAPRSTGFLRFEPKDVSLSTRIRALVDRKAKKLGKYQGPSCTTVLLIENDDIALMNEGKMLEGIQEAYPEGCPPGVDEIWFADTSIPDNPQFYDFTTRIVEE